MNIRIVNLSLTNFKCFKQQEFDFNKDIVTICGRNGAGKTTIADAILFCLFGKNTEGQSDLELFKTRENGKVVPNLEHSVEMCLSILKEPNGGANLTALNLKRSIKEVWVKKRGSEETVFKNNTVEYFINGESQTKADYEKYISTLVDERVFRAITNPTYFPSLKWQDQRSFLTAMVGSIEPECFADTDELKEIVDYFDQHDEDIESYLKHLKYQIKQINEKLDKIPVRLEEQNKALPEKLDWDALNKELDKAQSELEEVEKKVAYIQQGNGADVKRNELSEQIKGITAKRNIIYEAAVQQNLSDYKDKQKQISDATLKFNEALNNQKLMEQTIEADKRLVERCKETMAECDKTLERLREEWPTQKFEIDQSTSICPTCGQPLPQEQWEKNIEQMRTEFNLRKEAKKKELNERAAKVKKDKEDAEKEIVSYQNKLQRDTDSLEEVKQSINTIFAEKADLEKIVVKTVDELLAESAEFNELTAAIDQLKEQQSAITDSEDNQQAIDELKVTKGKLNEDIETLRLQLATHPQYDRIQQLIDGIKAEEKDLVKQLSELEKKEDIARQYQFRQNQLLEERINKHFKLVQWKLFRTVNNGGDSFEEPFCECYVDGVGYHSGLNQAARLNAGLDICEALCNFYNVSAPIVIDNAESNLNIYQTTGQQIRLQVADTELQIV